MGLAANFVAQVFFFSLVTSESTPTERVGKTPGWRRKGQEEGGAVDRGGLSARALQGEV